MKSITIQGYKSIKNAKMSDLSKVNYLIGENASGKSSVLESIQIFNEALNTRNDQEHFILSGVTKHAIGQDGFSFILETPTDHVIRMVIPANVTITNSQINHGPDIFHLDDKLLRQHEYPEFTDLIRRVALRGSHGGAFAINSVYLSTVNDTESGYYINPTRPNFSFSEVDSTTNDHLVGFLNKYYPLPKDKKIISMARAARSDQAILLRLAEEATHDGRKIVYKDSEEYIPIGSLSGGLRAMLRLYYGIEEQLRNIRSQDNAIRVICIEEPESGFHPKLQKEIPDILQDFIEKYSDLVFMITTHSPFVASSAAKFKDTQKMYLFDKGSLVDLNQDHVEESFGYKGGLCLNVVAQMLGAGFDDMGLMPQTNERFTVIYCEGADKSLKDSVLYKKIFADKNLIFISCADLVSAVYAFRLGLEGARFMLGKDTRVKALVDRSFGCRVKGCDKQGVEPHSHDFPLGKQAIEKTHPKKPIFTDEERLTIMKTDSEGRIQVLSRKEIENYLFDPDVVAFLSEKEQKLIEIPKDLDVIRGEVKDRVKFKADKIKIMHRLADIIYEKKDDVKVKPIYDELSSYVLS
jgi:predicted ATPase